MSTGLWIGSSGDTCGADCCCCLVYSFGCNSCKITDGGNKLVHEMAACGLSLFSLEALHSLFLG